jgi:hypothetical protein
MNFSARSFAASLPIDQVGRFRVGILACTAPQAATSMAAKVLPTDIRVSARGTLKVVDWRGKDGASMLAMPAHIATRLSTRTCG